jgi:DNA-binding transcriptional LysR family regulator
MPTVKELEAFIAVLEAGSFEGAARRLNATSPAVSKRISELESELGVRLFERTTRRCHITLRGRALVPYAERVLADISEIQRTVGELSSLSGHVRLGVPESIACTLLPEILKSVTANLPELTMGINVGASVSHIREVRSRLKNGGQSLRNSASKRSRFPVSAQGSAHRCCQHCLSCSIRRPID